MIRVRVIDGSNETPIPSATIILLNASGAQTLDGGVTDLDGYADLPQAGTYLFSMLGFERVTVSVREPVTVALSPKAYNLEEFEVVATRKRKTFPLLLLAAVVILDQ